MTCALASAPTYATVLLDELSLSQVTDLAACVVHGTVTHVDIGRDDAGLPATWVRIEIAECLKGVPRTEIAIKQFGVAEALPDGTVTGVGLLPTYRVGEELVLFLTGESERGFCSPVGLVQGVYRVERGAFGPRARRDAGAVRGRDLDEFLREVRALVANPP